MTLTKCVAPYRNFWHEHCTAHITVAATLPLCDFSVIFADDVLLVLDKPSGLLSVPGRGLDKQDCLSARVQKQYPEARVVHRLDMATSGLLVMARGGLAQRQLNAAFATRAVHKQYEAIVDGVFCTAYPDQKGDWSVIDQPVMLDWPNRPKSVIDLVHGKPSVTRWRPLSVNVIAQTTRLELEPVTGRSHQLRVHLLAQGHPILGDRLYGSEAVGAKAGRLLLHATRIELPHPISHKTLSFQSTAPF